MISFPDRVWERSKKITDAYGYENIEWKWSSRPIRPDDLENRQEVTELLNRRRDPVEIPFHADSAEIIAFTPKAK